MSVLVPFWLIVRPLTRHFRIKRALYCWVALAVFWVWSFVPNHINSWNKHHNGGVKWITIYDMISSSPVGYVHVFCAGIPAARLFMLLGIEDADRAQPPNEYTTEFRLKRSDTHFIFNWGACIGYMCLLLVFLNVDYDSHWIFYHSGGLLPFMIPIIWGLSLGRDPIAYVFQYEPFPTLGRISYALYIVQFRVWWTLWKIGGGPMKRSFPIYLLAVSYLIHRYVEVPYMEWIALRREFKVRGLDDRLVQMVDDSCELAYGYIRGFLRAPPVDRIDSEDERSPRWQMPSESSKIPPDGKPVSSVPSS